MSRKQKLKILIEIGIIMPTMILLSLFECLVLKSAFSTPLVLINIFVGLIFYIILDINASLVKRKYSYHQQRKIKIGLDIHGCATADPKFFSELSKTLVESNHEVHILTGSMITDKVVEELHSYGMHWTHLFSIADYYKSKPGIQMDFDEEGRPWVSDELWNMAKGTYSKEQELDLVLDDTAEYGKYFSTSFAHCTIVNKSGKERKPKAKRPPKTWTN